MGDDAVTVWYPASIPPTRKGVYERSMPSGFGKYSYWNGKFWGGYAAWVARANEPDSRKCVSQYQDVMWRGLANKPA